MNSFLDAPKNQGAFSRRYENNDYHLDKPPQNYGQQGFEAFREQVQEAFTTCNRFDGRNQDSSGVTIPFASAMANAALRQNQPGTSSSSYGPLFGRSSREPAAQPPEKYRSGQEQFGDRRNNTAGSYGGPRQATKNWDDLERRFGQNRNTSHERGGPSNSASGGFTGGRRWDNASGMYEERNHEENYDDERGAQGNSSLGHSERWGNTNFEDREGRYDRGGAGYVNLREGDGDGEDTKGGSWQLRGGGDGGGWWKGNRGGGGSGRGYGKGVGGRFWN